MSHAVYLQQPCILLSTRFRTNTLVSALSVAKLASAETSVDGPRRYALEVHLLRLDDPPQVCGKERHISPGCGASACDIVGGGKHGISFPLQLCLSAGLHNMCQGSLCALALIPVT